MPVSLQELGDQVRSSREDQGVSQEALAQQISPPTNRSQVAHLEQGIRVPPSDVLERICTKLSVPSKYWKPFTEPTFRRRLEFEEAISELVGRPVTLRFVDEHSDAVAAAAIVSFFGQGRSEAQARDALNAILVFYAVAPVSAELFSRYFGVEATKSTADLLARVRAYQADAIRLFGTFGEAYSELNREGSLEVRLAALQPIRPAAYHGRQAAPPIEEIPDANLPDLGYISAKRAQEERNERLVLADFLRELAGRVESLGKNATEEYSEKRRRKMSSLLRKLKSRIEHDFMSPLFTPDAAALRREADMIAPKGDTDLARIAATQAQAQRNLSRYLAADHLDVYVATSMRSDADFVSVNGFVRELFEHPDVKPLNLRYFNPTQSWIDDRVAKGLVEALMLRRSSMTIYMAQKVDTFGKDSEASVALGQGKPVIVYVPKLKFGLIDSEDIGAFDRGALERAVADEGELDDKESDPTMDRDALVARLLTIRLGRVSAAEFPAMVRAHWADFDLYGEDGRIGDLALRESYRTWLDSVVRAGSDEPPEDSLRKELVGMLVAIAVRFEARATLFRAIHPLALQVILSTRVLNGILVARSVETCASLVDAVVKNDLRFSLEIDEENYRLVENMTRSTARVISRHTLITNAFQAFYSQQPK